MELFFGFRQTAERDEEKSLHPLAARSSDHSRQQPVEEDHRLPYQRDVDRIVHSKAYARYVDKTQVVYLVDNDHICHRSLHVQLVSQFARGIAQILRLNTNLVEAIALGHDVGHPPFGHEGEGYLSALSCRYLGFPFAHPFQSCRLFSSIEPLNLGLAVYDGFLCHDGGLRDPQLRPHFGKSWSDHLRELEAKQADPEVFLLPATLEGCLVKLCDTMSYLGRDIEDAIQLNIIDRSQVPATPLGKTNREILGHLARDIIEQSYGKEAISLSAASFEALHRLREFNFAKIYTDSRLKVESLKIEQAYGFLFSQLLEELEQKGRESLLWRQFVNNKTAQYQNETSPAQMVVDFIAGMTDNYFVRMVERWLLPKRIELSPLL